MWTDANSPCCLTTQNQHASIDLEGSVQVNLAPLATQLETLRLTPPAQISPALDDLYVLLGQPVDPAAAGQAEALVAQVLGAISTQDMCSKATMPPPSAFTICMVLVDPAFRIALARR